MTLIMMESFEDFVSRDWTVQAGLYVTGRSGKAVRTPSGDTTTYTLVAPLTGFVLGFGWRPVSNPANVTLRIRNTTNVQLSMVLDPADNKFTLYRGLPASNVLGKSTTSFVANTWNYIEIKVGSSGFVDTGGTVEVRINGVTEITYSGDTLSTAASPASMTGFEFFTSTSADQYLDDVYLCSLAGSAPFNDFLGDVVVERLLPSGNGDSSAWVGSDSNSTDNYALVDDISSTDYVTSGTVGARDLYAMADPNAALGTVMAVQPVYLAAKSDVGSPAGPLDAVLKSVGGTVVTDEAVSLAAANLAYGWFGGSMRLVDPNGDPWTLARLNGLQVGQEVGT